MEEKYQELQRCRQKLEHEIKIAEMSNDSYYLSKLYKAHQAEFYRLTSLIKALRKSDLSTEQKK